MAAAWVPLQCCALLSLAALRSAAPQPPQVASQPPRGNCMLQVAAAGPQRRQHSPPGGPARGDGVELGELGELGELERQLLRASAGLDWEGLRGDLEAMGLRLSGAAARAPGGRRKPMMWIHLHKAAGSFMCAAAILNGEHVVEPGGNCNWWGHDGGSGGLWPERTNCSTRTAYFEEHNYTWGQVERVLADELCFHAFDYGTWLRDPLRLAESAANFADNGEDWTRGDVLAHLDCVARTPGEPCRAHSRNPELPLWMYFDNYAVRTLGGPEIWQLPPGRVEERHAELAWLRLSRFAFVSTMEEVVSSQSAKDVLFAKTAWSLWPGVNDTSNPQGTRFAHGHAIQFTGEEQALIRDLDRYDYMLYARASARLAHARAHAA